MPKTKTASPRTARAASAAPAAGTDTPVLDTLRQQFMAGAFAAVIPLAREVLDADSPPVVTDGATAGQVLGWLGYAQAQQGDVAGALDTALDMIDIREMWGADATGELALIETQGLLQLGLMLEQRGDLSAAAGAFSRIGGRYFEIFLDQPEQRALLETAAQRKAVLHGAFGQDAAVVLDPVRAAFGQDPGRLNPPAVARQLLHRAFLYSDYRLFPKMPLEAELGLYQAIEEIFGGNRLPGVQRVVARALLNSASLHFARGDQAAELACFDALWARFATATDPEMQDLVARGLLNKALRQPGPLAAQDTLTMLRAHYDRPAAPPAVQLVVARALLAQSELDYDARSGRGVAKAARATLAAVVTRFAACPDAALQYQVTRARFGLAALDAAAER